MTHNKTSILLTVFLTIEYTVQQVRMLLKLKINFHLKSYIIINRTEEIDGFTKYSSFMPSAVLNHYFSLTFGP
jgi:hypothetical protein